MRFKEVVDAVHDIKKTVELDGEGWVPKNHTIWVTQQQWDELVTDTYLQTLPTEVIDDLVKHIVLGVNILVRP